MAQSVALGRRRSVARVLAAAGPKSSPAMSVDAGSTGRSRPDCSGRRDESDPAHGCVITMPDVFDGPPAPSDPSCRYCLGAGHRLFRPHPQQGIGQAAPETARDRRAVPARWERGRGGFRLNPVVRGWSAYYRSVVSGRVFTGPVRGRASPDQGAQVSCRPLSSAKPSTQSTAWSTAD